MEALAYSLSAVAIHFRVLQSRRCTTDMHNNDGEYFHSPWRMHPRRTTVFTFFFFIFFLRSDQMRTNGTKTSYSIIL